MDASSLTDIEILWLSADDVDNLRGFHVCAGCGVKLQMDDDGCTKCGRCGMRECGDG